MKRSIVTKYIPCTATKPNRIKAFDNCGNSMCVCSDNLPYSSHDEKSHKIVANRFKRQMGWTGGLIGGHLKDSSYVFVFKK